VPRRLVSIAPAVLLITAFGVAGCGAENSDSAKKFTGDQQQVAQVIEDLEKAAVKARTPDGKKICTELITDQLAKTISSQHPDKNCDQQIKDSLDDRAAAGGVATLEVIKVTIAGNKAVASVKAKAGNDDETSDYALVKSGNSWRISSF
jgi:hypothetical protein